MKNLVNSFFTGTADFIAKIGLKFYTLAQNFKIFYKKHMYTQFRKNTHVDRDKMAKFFTDYFNFQRRE